jgi:hypothetical protein
MNVFHLRYVGRRCKERQSYKEGGSTTPQIAVKDGMAMLHWLSGNVPVSYHQVAVDRTKRANP